MAFIIEIRLISKDLLHEVSRPQINIRGGQATRHSYVQLSSHMTLGQSQGYFVEQIKAPELQHSSFQPVQDNQKL
jgi:hypothetical protein